METRVAVMSILCGRSKGFRGAVKWSAPRITENISSGGSGITYPSEEDQHFIGRPGRTSGHHLRPGR